ncbi:MAG: serine protein kinase RIO [Candidatus Thermoplasmatota archaeon]
MDDAYRRLEIQRDKLRIKDKDEEERKTYDEVFDKQTLLALYDLMSSGLIETVDFPISTGKEGNVFRATGKSSRLLAVKIYRIATATFHAINKYIVGDPRFKGLERNRRKLIFAWAQKEYKNLLRLREHGVRVPAPQGYSKNVLVMEYIGDEHSPAPMLRDVVLERPEAFLEDMIEMMRRAYVGAGIVHADMSEYNILVHDGLGVIIDVGQAVTRDHVNAAEYLERDVANLLRYFSRLGVRRDRAEVLAHVRGEK